MKVCHIFGYGPDKLGGIENYIFKMQEICSKQGIEIIFVFTREPIKPFKEVFSKINGKYIVVPSNKKVIDLVFMKHVYKILKQFRPDVVHSHFDSANLNVAIIANILGTKKVYWHQRNLFGTKLFKLRNLIYRAISKKVTKIIAVSDGVKNDLLSRGIEDDKIWKLYNGIDIHKMKGTNLGILRNELSIEDKRLVITVAQARPEKDLKTLLKAIPLIHKSETFIFIIIGGGDLLNDLREEVIKLKLVNVVFMEKRNDIKDLMAEGEIFILPSKKEGMPNVILEAMINKVPVIASMAGGIPEVVKNEETGLLFEIGNYKQLSEKMNQLASNSQLVASITNKAYQEVIERFDLDKVIKITIDDYLS